jgi:hypothetical protein
MNTHHTGQLQTQGDRVNDLADLEGTKLPCIQFRARASSLDMVTIKKNEVTYGERRCQKMSLC